MMFGTVQKVWICGGVLAAMALAGCGSDDDGGSQAATTGSESSGSSSAPGSEGSTSASAGESSTSASAGESSTTMGPGAESSSSTGGMVDIGDPFDVLCGTVPPDDAAEPAPLPVPTGMCPGIVPGINMIESSGNAREMIVVAPSDLQPDEQLPVAFLWHWLGGSPEDFVEIADVQNAVDQFRFLAIAPRDKGDLTFRWPFTTIDPDERLEEELVFFDDMLACVAESYPIDNSCVTSVGVSAGALFTSQLGAARSEHLSSMVVLSGGTGGLVRPWEGAEHILPAMVLWGGEDDFCVAVDFAETSADLEQGLQADGHAVVECVHNCGHTAPPFDSGVPDVTSFASMWRFFLDHPYWLAAGETPWAEELPGIAPQWCGVGVGAAEQRAGECPDGPGC